MLSAKGIHTSSLNTDQARAQFSDFVRAWNKGKLAARYYAGIEPTSISSSSRSDHRWAFSGIDSQHLASIRNEVNRATSSGKSTSVSAGGAHEAADDYFAPYAASSSAIGPAPPSKPSYTRPSVDIEEKEHEYEQLKRERKDFRRQQKHDEEELAPRASGRDRVFEKRREENYARRSHEAQRLGDTDVDPYDDRATTSITSHVRAQEVAAERRREERASVMNEKLQASQAKEDKVMAQLRDLARNAGHRV